MPQLVKFKNNFIRICPENSIHLLKSEDCGKSWTLLFDGTIMMKSITDIACDGEILLLDSNKGFFYSETGDIWTKISNVSQLLKMK